MNGCSPISARVPAWTPMRVVNRYASRTRGKKPGFPSSRRERSTAGLAAVFAFPLRHGNGQLGALDLYRDTPGPLEPSGLKSAQTLADVAAAYLINAGTRSELEAAFAPIREAALHDPLTGLANRVLLFEFLDASSPERLPIEKVHNGPFLRHRPFQTDQ